MKRIISILTVLVLLLSCPVAMAYDCVEEEYPPGTSFGTEGIYSYRQYKDNIIITECSDKTVKCLEIPQIINGAHVTEIDEYVFCGFQNLESVTLPDSITVIRSHAFYNCPKLTTVKFPASLKTIGDEAFKYCRSLKSDVVLGSITVLGKMAFYGCESLESVEILSNLGRIEEYLFYECISLKSVKLPDSLTYIGTLAFYKCPITEINIPDGVTEIGGSAFSSTKITSVTLPSGIKNIGGDAFSYTDITSLVIPKSVTVIPNGMVSGCSKLKTITLPDTIVEIGASAFANTAVEQIEIPASVKTIGDRAFDSTDLKEIKLPEGVEFISQGLFDQCTNLKQVYFPASVNTIYIRAFKDCFKLTDIYYGGTRNQFKEIIINKFTTADMGCLKIHYNEPFEKETVDTSKKFNDVKAGKWYKQYIDYAYTNGIFDGMSKTTFAPESSITRAQFVMVLANISGIYTNSINVAPHKKDDYGLAFVDVDYNKWYSCAIAWAYDNDIVAGVSENSFAPNMPITREQMCTMLVRYANYCGVTLKQVEAKTAFSDDKSISKWAKNAVYACQMADIVNGKGANEFDPKNTGTRAEAAVIFTKFRKSYLKGE